jgi:hypothetical protein
MAAACEGGLELGLGVGTGQPGGFPGRVGPGTGTGSSFSGPENPRYIAGLLTLNLLWNLVHFKAVGHGYRVSMVLPSCRQPLDAFQNLNW